MLRLHVLNLYFRNIHLSKAGYKHELHILWTIQELLVVENSNYFLIFYNKTIQTKKKKKGVINCHL